MDLKALSVAFKLEADMVDLGMPHVTGDIACLCA